MVQQSIQQQAVTATGPLQDIQGDTIRIARLKLLFIAAKTPFHDNRKTVEYSEQDMRTPFLYGCWNSLMKHANRPSHARGKLMDLL